MSTKVSLGKQLAEVAEYMLLRLVLASCKIVCEKCSKNKYSDEENTELEQKANLQKILWRAKPHEAVDAFPGSNFLLKHEKWVEPTFALQDNVHLFGISPCGQYVIFTVTEEDEDVYSSNHGPFLYISQYRLATHLLTMSMENFIQMANNLPQVQVKVVLVANTGRCGSTLLAQMLETVPGVRVLSEPHSLLETMNLHNREIITDSKYKQLINLIIKVHCHTPKHIHTVIIKPVFKCTPQIKFIVEGLPSTKVVFLFRNVEESVASFMRVMSAFKTLSSLFTNNIEMMKYWMTDLPLPWPNTSYRWARDHHLGTSLSLPAAIALNWAATITCVKDYMEQGLAVLPLDYKDLVGSSSHETWSHLVNYCGLDLEGGIPALVQSRDSQRGSFLDKALLPGGNKSQDHSKEEVQKIVKAFQLEQGISWPSQEYIS